MATRIAIINGPNLNLLGKRNTDIYGVRHFEDYLEDLRISHPGCDLDYYQSNHEGQIIDWLHEFGFSGVRGIVLNAGGYSHTSVAIRDAIDAIPVPVVNVHISDIYSREPFRHVDLIADVCAASIVGEGLDGYRRAVELVAKG